MNCNILTEAGEDILTEDGFELVLETCPDSTVITDFNVYFNSATGCYQVYDVDLNYINICFIRKTGQLIPAMQFVDPSPIPNALNVPMVGDDNIVRVLADNGGQPGFAVSRFLYKAGNTPVTILVDIRNHPNLTSMTINRITRFV